MCLIFIALKQHPDYKLIIAANRDEFYNRKTAPADFWTENPFVVGGKDLEAGGTWLGMNKSGKISMITNFRDPKNINPNAPSRGHLVSEFLLDNADGESYIKKVEAKGKAYNGFNLVVGDSTALYYHSNYNTGIVKMTNGLYGLSNHLLDTPWPKVVRGKEKMSVALAAAKPLKESFFNILFDDVMAEDVKLPDTGVGLERERVLSSMFIKSPGYGTRCSTVIMVGNDNEVSFTERVFDLSTFEYQERLFLFSIQ